MTTRRHWFSALLAYGTWGLFPLFWRLFADIPAFEIVLQRSVWCAVFLAGVIAFTRRESVYQSLLAGWRERRILVPTSILIGMNWWIYVWAVTHGRVLGASLGYFICPFVQILFGTLFHGERVSREVGVAICVSLAGVAWISFASGLAEFPWVAIVLAISFALYGSLKKNTGVPAISGAFFEAFALGAPALALILIYAIGSPNNLPVFYAQPRFWILNVLGGALTALPLILYSLAARHLSLASMGFLQFLNPTLQFTLAITVLGEVLLPEKLIGFGLIWMGVALYIFAKLRSTCQTIVVTRN